MSSTRAFKNLATLRDRFVETPFEEEEAGPQVAAPSMAELGIASESERGVAYFSGAPHSFSTVRKVDGRRARKVLKTPSVSLSVAVRREIHEDVSAMLFARKSTWIGLLDELLRHYVQDAKASGNFPK